MNLDAVARQNKVRGDSVAVKTAIYSISFKQ